MENGELRKFKCKKIKKLIAIFYGYSQFSILNSQLLLCLALLLLVSCTSKHRGQGYFEGRQQALPDSARVKAVVSVSQGEAKEKLSAVLFAVPNERYRLELSGTFGLSAASILWKKDGWRIVFPQNERYMEGTGDCVFVPVYGGVDIHKFAALFFGQKTNSLNCNASNPQNLTMEYDGNFVSVKTDNYPSLQLEIKNIDPKAQWKSGVWNLNVPESYVRITDY
jgi:hypothetical protein